MKSFIKIIAWVNIVLAIMNIFFYIYSNDTTNLLNVFKCTFFAILFFVISKKSQITINMNGQQIFIDDDVKEININLDENVVETK